jgi:hypothetical protein
MWPAIKLIAARFVRKVAGVLTERAHDATVASGKADTLEHGAAELAAARVLYSIATALYVGLEELEQ